MLKKKLLTIFAVAFVAVAVLALGRRVYSAGEVDFIEGTKIPEMLVGSHYFETDAKTASWTLDQDDNFYLIDSSGGAITVTLPTPSTLATGKCWGMVLVTAGNAVTLNAGTYSVDGATSTNAMDAAGDSYILCNNGAGYNFLARYIH